MSQRAANALSTSARYEENAIDLTQHVRSCARAVSASSRVLDRHFLVRAIARDLGLPANPACIDRAVYKSTVCGAWVRFDEEGIVVGTIVEGSDAEHSKRIDLAGITMDEAGEAVLNRRFWAAIEQCEAFADEEQLWAACESDGE